MLELLELLERVGKVGDIYLAGRPAGYAQAQGGKHLCYPPVHLGRPDSKIVT